MNKDFCKKLKSLIASQMNSLVCLTDEHKLRDGVIKFEEERANLYKKYQVDVEQTKSVESFITILKAIIQGMKDEAKL